ncbi:unnamed protein product [Cylicostephanus goldi]|uniref:MULE transposase domain-containing protein n=1 Tax=Cylicostephanus goldi TaxID=71465 RepID=A0A3P7MN93_CYLGO|nr:unnamed protein product [Cylicostephanus goldi]
MDNVPDELRYLPDGSLFLQVQESELHIYISRSIVKLAVDNGLSALIADGIHQLNPRSRTGSGIRMEQGQVYTVHGVCSGGFEMPLMFAIMRKKREEDYRVVFEKLKENINDARPGLGEPQLKFVVDFELVCSMKLKLCPDKSFLL